MSALLHQPRLARWRRLFTPSEREVLRGVCRTRGALILTVLRQVVSDFIVWRYQPPADPASPPDWILSHLPVAPAAGPRAIRTASVWSVDSDQGDRYWLSSSGYTEPPTLYLGDVAAPPRLGEHAEGGLAGEAVKALPAMFRADGLLVTQEEAVSKDGTRVPYFLVRSDHPLDGSTPTLVYAYGGFEVSMLPGYSGEVGAGWLERGGAYAVACLRGGGEFGPTWHQAAVREKRQRAYEDLFAVAEALIGKGLTSARRLGLMGGSNGGLLVGNALVQRPELWGALVGSVPLLDMRRYHKLLAGASWVEEYGWPDGPDWLFLQRYSPYHRIPAAAAAAAALPPVLWTTSTRDDRVHPAHARKMTHRLRCAAGGGLGASRVHLYENIEGGHGGAADSQQRAFLSALSYSFLWKTLSVADPAAEGSGDSYWRRGDSPA